MRWGREAKSRIVTLDLKREYFGLFKALLGRTPLETVVEKSELVGFQRSPSPTSILFHADEQENRGSRMPSWVNKELLTKINQKEYRR